MDFEGTVDQGEVMIINYDPEEEMGPDEMFKSIIETKSIRKDDSVSLINIEEYASLELCKVTDIDEVRLFLPSINDYKITPVMVWKLIKDMIGKDMTKLELPCFINEPTSILERLAESSFLTNGLTKASQQNESCLRMVYVASTFLSFMLQCVYRTKKPFNPLLGETYELVTPTFRYYSEMVSHHPPIIALNC
jgi:hypothetical protein